MLRRSFWLAMLILVCGSASMFGAAALLLKHEPAFYTTTPAGGDWGENLALSARLVTRVQDLKNDIRSNREWGTVFTAADLNCFFAENLGNKGGLAGILPEHAHSARAVIDGDVLKVGFRYGRGFWSTVVWVELRVWLVANEVNLAAVEICDLGAGLLPLGTQSILDSVTESARESNIEVTWYRGGRNPVGLFRFFADQRAPTSQLLTLEVKDGKVVIAGRSFLDQPSTGAAGRPESPGLD